MVILKLTQGECIKLYGPMSVTVKSGCLNVYYKKACAGDRFVVHKARNYVVEALDECELDVSMINNSQIQPIELEDPYWEKKKIISDIVKGDHRKIMVIGCIDCGKTALVTMLYNAFAEKNLRVAVIDGDVGQADIGPPGFVTLGSHEEQVYWISELKPIMMRFIGDIKPQFLTHVIIRELEYLTNYALNSGFDRVVIDTDGWVSDEHAITYKQKLVEALRPETIVVIGDNIEKYFAKYAKLGIAVYSVKPPVHRKTRSREERRMLRSSRYKSYLSEAPLVKVKLDEVLVSGLPLLQGPEVDSSLIHGFIEGKLVYASQMPCTLYLYGSVKSYNIEELKKLGYDKVKVYPIGFEKNLYCAVGSTTGSEYPCLLEKIDFESREVHLRTKYTGKIEFLKISRIRLNDEYLEEYVEA